MGRLGGVKTARLITAGHKGLRALLEDLQAEWIEWETKMYWFDEEGERAPSFRSPSNNPLAV